MAKKLLGLDLPAGGYLSHYISLIAEDGTCLAYAQIAHDPTIDRPNTAFVEWIKSSEPRRGYGSELLRQLEARGITPTWSHRGNGLCGGAFIAAYEHSRGRDW